jgi:hypothetical protein
MYSLSDFGVFANFVLQSLQQTMRPLHMLCCLSRSGVRIGVMGYNHLRSAIVREGYEHGIVHDEAYHRCFPLRGKK